MRLGKSLQDVFASAVVIAAAGLVPASAHATAPPEYCYDCTISFSSGGTITVDLLGNGGLFDHVLQVTSGGAGPVPSPIFALLGTDPNYPHALVAGKITPDASSKSFSYAGGNLELTFALSSYDPSTSGFPLATVVSTGTSTGAGTIGTGSLSFVQGLGTNSVTVHMTDLFAGSTPDELRNMEFQVTLAPVPEPQEWAMMLAGLGVIGAVARRRRNVEAQ